LLLVTSEKVDYLAATFASADADNSGEIDYAEFLAIFELKDGNLTKALGTLYDVDGSGGI